jgi:hypothetical protein
MIKLLSVILLEVAVFGCTEKAQVINRCYIQTEVQKVPDTIFVANPDTTWLSDSVFIVSVLSRDTVTRHVSVDTTFERSREPEHILKIGYNGYIVE